MLPIEPWIKILKTANTQEQANKIVQKLKNKGYKDLATLNPQGNNKNYRIGVFDESKIDALDEFDSKQVTTYEKCAVCGKSKIETKFFLCVNCDCWECYECGFKRLFNEKIPEIHTCGKDNFELLANIGPCINCGENLGFKSIPPILKYKMMSRLQIGKIQMMTLGLSGAFVTEKILLDKEIALIYDDIIKLIDIYKKDNLNSDDWFNLYKKIKSNINRMENNSDYILQVSDKIMHPKLINMYQQISTKMHYIHSELEFQKILHHTVINMLDNKISKMDYDKIMSSLVNAFGTSDASPLPIDIKESLARLSVLSDKIKINENFDELKTLIGNLFITDNIKNIMKKIPAHLKC
ncbi:MAG: hypothetical protein JXA99_12540 [Candidatus Lokiarchaeota archaeon]|nr:hypothetical protein [Candidatus Lokiarchaeota archaeon]